jgi:hypothetical protein
MILWLAFYILDTYYSIIVVIDPIMGISDNP